jgi:hypothetical protein
MTDQTQRQKQLRYEQWLYGFKLAEAFQPIELCTNNDQRQGFRSCVRAEADCETYGYLTRTRDHETM